MSALQPHGLQHARPPCPSPTPGVYSNSCPLSQWCHPTISSSVVPFSSCLQAFPASESFQMSQLFASGGQNIGVSASASVPPMNIQDWSAPPRSPQFLLIALGAIPSGNPATVANLTTREDKRPRTFPMYPFLCSPHHCPAPSVSESVMVFNCAGDPQTQEWVPPASRPFQTLGKWAHPREPLFPHMLGGAGGPLPPRVVVRMWDAYAAPGTQPRPARGGFRHSRVLSKSWAGRDTSGLPF